MTASRLAIYKQNRQQAMMMVMVMCNLRRKNLKTVVDTVLNFTHTYFFYFVLNIFCSFVNNEFEFGM